MSFGVGLLSQTDEVILSQLCSKAKTGQSSKALGKESTESNENRAEYTQSLHLHRPLPQQLNNSCLRLLSAPPNKTSPPPPTPSFTHKSTELPAWLWGVRGQSRYNKEIYTHFPHMHTRTIALFTSRWNVLWNSHPSPRLTPNLDLLAFIFSSPK